jgi:hypothetical protein
MNHSDVQRSDEGVNVSAPVISIGSSALRRWGLRVVGAALLAAPMLLALSGPAQASELEPSGSGGAFTAASLLLLLAGVMASVRLFRPSFRSSLASRLVAWRSATLALSVERPG